MLYIFKGCRPVPPTPQSFYDNKNPKFFGPCLKNNVFCSMSGKLCFLFFPEKIKKPKFFGPCMEKAMQKDSFTSRQACF